MIGLAVILVENHLFVRRVPHAVPTPAEPSVVAVPHGVSDAPAVADSRLAGVVSIRHFFP